jgi:hypothetical protein
MRIILNAITLPLVAGTAAEPPFCFSVMITPLTTATAAVTAAAITAAVAAGADTVPRDRQLRRAPPLHKREVMAGKPQRRRTQALRPGCRHELPAPDLHRQDGPRRHVGGRRHAETIWNTEPSHRRRIGHSPSNNRQHLAPYVIIGEPAAEILKSQHTI